MTGENCITQNTTSMYCSATWFGIGKLSARLHLNCPIDATRLCVQANDDCSEPSSSKPSIYVWQYWLNGGLTSR